jgi:hypothetical protein
VYEQDSCRQRENKFVTWLYSYMLGTRLKLLSILFHCALKLCPIILPPQTTTMKEIKPHLSTAVKQLENADALYLTRLIIAGQEKIG